MKKNYVSKNVCTSVLSGVVVVLVTKTTIDVATYVARKVADKVRAKRAENRIKVENIALRSTMMWPVVLDERRECLDDAAKTLADRVREVLSIELEWVNSLSDQDIEVRKEMRDLLTDILEMFNGLSENMSFENAFKRNDMSEKIKKFYQLKESVQLNTEVPEEKASIEKDFEEDYDDILDEVVEDEFENEEREMEEEASDEKVMYNETESETPETEESVED